MPHGVGRHYGRQRLLVTLVEFLGKALKHGVIVDGYFRQAVPVQEQKIAVPVNLNSFRASFHLVLFLASRHAPFHEGKSLDTL
ncbi:hypothetical protein BW28_00045 [Clostridioides difficile]|nr:hypothetical protein BW28_00045 [Clostridioides difficile]